MADDATKSGPRESTDISKASLGAQFVAMIKQQGIFCVFFCVAMYFCYTIVVDLRASNKEMTDGFRKIAVDSAVSLDKNTNALNANTAQSARTERVLERIERKQIQAEIPPLRVPYVVGRAPVIEENNE